MSTRQARRESRDRDHLEKSRLLARTGSYHRYEEIPIISPVADCPSSLSPSAALISTEQVAPLERLDREHQQAIKLEFLEKRRAESFARDSQKWAFIQAKDAADQARLTRLQSDPFVGKKNSSGHPFNIISLDYNNSTEGKELKYHDDLCAYRRDLRKNFLAAQAHLGWNPITGESIVDLTIPIKPVKGPSLQSNN
jgi:hypothetical protein